jgi:hypothetical protein
MVNINIIALFRILSSLYQISIHELGGLNDKT